MKWTVGMKISIGFSITLLIFLFVGLFTYNSIINSQEASKWKSHTYEVINDLDLLISYLKDAETGQRGYLLTGIPDYLEPYNLSLTKISDLIKTIRKLTSDNNNQQKRIDILEPLINKKLMELTEAINLRKTKGLQSALEIVLSSGKKYMDDVRRVVLDMRNEEAGLLDIRSQQDEIDSNKVKSVIIYGLSLSMILALIIGFVVTRNISTPLKEITSVAKQFSTGNLTLDLKELNRKDEIGVLSESFIKMVKQLRGSIKEISVGVNLLGSSASEILAATTQVASGSAETATAIAETTSTVEEVRQAAQLSSQKAARVVESAQVVVDTSEVGLKSVDDTMKGMHHIQNQMEAVAQTVIRLSEQSQQIGGIIASVNDIADQSNLLAVNAAIEAAKAGEQGKGFSVVAQEIKSLAKQSKEATSQIRTILMDIQRATSAAVMATEQGSKAVESGVSQSALSLESIQKLSESSEKAVEVAKQIVASSQQQVVGMDQMGIAMENINQAGKENAASMIQAEKAAKDLNLLGQKLKLLVDQYKM